MAKPDQFQDARSSGVRLSDWRKRPPAEVVAQRGDLFTLLLENTGFVGETKQQLIAASASGDDDAVLAVADVIGAQGEDLVWSWVALAAAMGNRAACMQLAAELYQRSKFRRPRFQRTKLRVLAAEWAGRITGELNKFGEERTNALTDMACSGIIKVTAALREESAAQSRLAADGRPAMLICSEIPLLKGDRDDKALVEGWSVLTKPLPLVIGPPPHIVGTVLSTEFPWAQDAVEAIVGDLELRNRLGERWSRFRPMLLVGPPGTGKTRFARRVGRILGVGYGELSTAGSSDNRLLAGTARGWASAQPSYVLQVMRTHRSANPVITVDEIDKTRPDGRNGDIRQTLLPMLEPTTAKAWLDECLAVPVNLSAVSWIITANDLLPIRGPLLTRLRIVEFKPPAPAHIDAVLAGVYRDLAEEFQVRVADLPPLSPESEAMIKEACKRQISLRRVRAACERALLGSPCRPTAN